MVSGAFVNINSVSSSCVFYWINVNNTTGYKSAVIEQEEVTIIKTKHIYLSLPIQAAHVAKALPKRSRIFISTMLTLFVPWNGKDAAHSWLFSSVYYLSREHLSQQGASRDWCTDIHGPILFVVYPFRRRWLISASWWPQWPPSRTWYSGDQSHRKSCKWLYCYCRNFCDAQFHFHNIHRIIRFLAMSSIQNGCR